MTLRTVKIALDLSSKPRPVDPRGGVSLCAPHPFCPLDAAHNLNVMLRRSFLTTSSQDRAKDTPSHLYHCHYGYSLIKDTVTPRGSPPRGFLTGYSPYCTLLRLRCSAVARSFRPRLIGLHPVRFGLGASSAPGIIICMVPGRASSPRPNLLLAVAFPFSPLATAGLRPRRGGRERAAPEP